MFMFMLNGSVSGADDFAEIRDDLEAELREVFHHQVIIGEIADRILLSTLKNDNFDLLRDNLKSTIDKEADRYIKELQMYCYRYALKLSSDLELAQDIAQDSLLELFRCKKEIVYVKGWLKGTVHNKVLSAWRDAKKDKNLIDKLIQQAEPIKDPGTISDEEMESKLSDEKIKTLLVPAEYEILFDMRNYETLKAYAENKNISHVLARKQRYVILKNLKAAYLKSIDWLGRREILSFKQFRNIRLFMKRLVECSNSGTMGKLLRHCKEEDTEELTKVISHLKQISDWTISFAEEDCFNLGLVDYDDKSAMVTMKIRAPKRGHIRIISARLLKCAERIPNPKNKKLPTLKRGFISMSIEEIRKYASN